MSEQGRLYTVAIAWIACVHYNVASAVSPCSGGVAVIGTEYNIQADIGSYTGFEWFRPSDGRPVVECYSSCRPLFGYGAVANATHTTLTIYGVNMFDAGTWRIATSVMVEVCQLTVTSFASTGSLCSGGVALLGKEYTIHSDRRIYDDVAWLRPSDRMFVGSCNDRYSRAPAGYCEEVVNGTHTTLTIDSVGMLDVGVWRLVDLADVLHVEFIQLAIPKIPHCNIGSDTNSTFLQPNTTLTVFVDIKGYFCPKETGFYLNTGNVTEMLMKQNVTGVSDIVTSSTFSVTPARLGDVTVSFMCDVNRWDLNCDGLGSLDVGIENPTDFFCTSHTESTLDLQWTYPGNTLYSFVFVLNYRLNDDKDGIDDRNMTIPTDKSETLHSTTLTELEPGSMYYFRLVVDGGSLGQSEAVTTTCFTRRSEDVGIEIPTDFFCTSHTESTLDLQWTYPGNTLHSLAFVLTYRLNDDKDGIDDRNMTIPTDKSKTLHSTTLTELEPGSMYYFRLVVDGGSLGQSEAVTTTCFTRRSEASELSLGACVAIGITATLAVLAVSLGVAYVIRRSLSRIRSGKDKDRMASVSQTSQQRTSSANNQTEEGPYEVPVPQNSYDDLQPRPFTEPPNVYEDLRQYYNAPR